MTIEVRVTEVFSDWLEELRDIQGKHRIISRIDRLSMGNPGDVKSVGDGVSELRIKCGPGYRLYFTKRGTAIGILLCGGDKSTQAKDIKRAIELAKEV